MPPGSLAQMNLAQAFAAAASRQPEKTALCWGDREITYATLHAQARAIAAALQSCFGVQPGDRVGIWLKNCPEFIPALFGILHAGGVVVPVNNFLKPAEVSHIVTDAGLDVLITNAELAVHFETLQAARPTLKLFKIEDFPTLNSQLPHSQLQLSAPSRDAVRAEHPHQRQLRPRVAPRPDARHHVAALGFGEDVRHAALLALAAQ